MEQRRVPIDSVNKITLVTVGDTDKKRTCKQRLCKVAIITTIVFFVLIILAFILIFVVLPVVFMHSIAIQRLVIFRSHNDTPSNSEFYNFKKYGIEGVTNFYITISDDPSVSLGLWHILPETLAKDAVQNQNFDYTQALADGTYPIILYFHETNGHRITPINTYKVLRKFFHVIAFDYRSYADSTEADLSEQAVIEDSVQLYKWLHTRTRGEIFVWGHSMGAALSTQTVAKLYELDIKPMGLFLEAPFTTMAKQFQLSTIADIFSWLVWYNVTIVDPLYENGFRFETSEHILSVDCPIMIVHAEDDSFTPDSLGKELYKIALQNRFDIQGNVSFYSFPAHLGYDHWRIYQSPELPGYITNHINVCRQHSEQRKRPLQY